MNADNLWAERTVWVYRMLGMGIPHWYRRRIMRRAS